MKFIDSVNITVEAGQGGEGALSFQRLPGRPNGPANGGDGGRGGHVILRGDHRLNTLLEFRFKPLHRAQAGQRGASNRKTGKNAPHTVLPVPLGTIVHRLTPDHEPEWLGEITEEGQELVVAQGGRSGKGNARFANPSRPRPDFVLEPDPGERVELSLNLKLMADVGLLGFPNAGKSTLIQAVSNARPEVANYPFTTKVPSLGVARHHGRDLVLADIPGLVEGASEGIGLGHQFLKHVERVRVLAHLVTLPDYVEDDEGLAQLTHAFEVIERELAGYSETLAQRPRIAVLSKADLPHVGALADDFQRWCGARAMRCIVISSHTKQGLDLLLSALAQEVTALPGASQPAADHFDPLGD